MARRQPGTGSRADGAGILAGFGGFNLFDGADDIMVKATRKRTSGTGRNTSEASLGPPSQACRDPQ